MSIYQTIPLYQPTAAGGTNTTVNPSAGTLAITGYAPSISQSQAITAGAGMIAITSYAPTVTQGITTNIAPGVGSLMINGYAPSITQSINQSITPGAGILTLAGYAPTIAQTANQTISPNVGVMIITGYAPIVTQQSASPNLVPGTGQITITGYVPDVYQSGQLPPARFNGGFEMVSMEPTWKRMLRQRYEAKQKVEFTRKQRKRAEHIEKLAAKEALSDHSEEQIEIRIDSLLAEWVELAPKLDLIPAKEMPKVNAEQAFMARVVEKIRKIDDENEEAAIEMLLLM